MSVEEDNNNEDVLESRIPLLVHKLSASGYLAQAISALKQVSFGAESSVIEQQTRYLEKRFADVGRAEEVAR